MRKGAAWVFVVLTLAFSSAHILLSIGNEALKDHNRDARDDITLETAKMKKQQAEYDTYLQVWPQVKADLDETLPRAIVITEKIDDLRGQRRGLRRQIDADTQALLAIEEEIARLVEDSLLSDAGLYTNEDDE